MDKLPHSLPDVLHLGCGRKKYPLAPAFGVDAAPDPAVDLVWDLDRRPWPLPDGVFGKVYLVNVRPKRLDRLLLKLANRHKDLYERRFLYWYQIRNIYFRLQAVKGP